MGHQQRRMTPKSSTIQLSAQISEFVFARNSDLSQLIPRRWFHQWLSIDMTCKWIHGLIHSSHYQCECLRVPESLSTMSLNRTSLELCQNLPGRSSTLTPPRILLKSTFCVCRSLEKRNTRCVVNFLGRASSLAPPILGHFRKNEHIFLDQISRISLHQVGKHPKIGSGDLKSWLRNVYWSVWERSIICLGPKSLPSEEIELNFARAKRTRIWDLRQFYV